MKSLSDYTYHKLNKKKSYEHIAFIVIIAIFSLGLLSNISYTGKVTGDKNYESYSIDKLFTENSNYTISLKGNITSIRASGEFIGTGNGKIYVNGILIVDSNDLENKGSLITGFAVSDVDSLDSFNSSDENKVEGNISDFVEPILENLTEILSEEEILIRNISIEEINNSFNITEFEIVLNDTNATPINSSPDDVETINENETQPELIIIKQEFSNYCLDSCSISLNGEITLLIELDHVWLNLSEIVYGFEDYIEIESNETIDELINGSLNLSLNLTDLNQSIISNYSLNITNVSFSNLSIVNITDLNISSNISVNLSIINITLLENITEIINATGQITRLLNLIIFEETEEFITAGIDLNNYIKFQKGLDSYVAIYNSTDSRINSKVILLENISYAEIVIEGEANSILKCEQYDDYCKKWKKTSIGYEKINESTLFIVNESGIYVTANLAYEKPGKIESSSVYLNSDCEYCEKRYNCNSDRFCVSQNTAGHRVTFTAQFDFDILNIESNVKNAEVCAFRYYYDEPSFNYIEYSSESHCSAKYQNSTSDIISYKFTSAKDGFVCIDATEILNYAIENKESNVFINWLGQDLNGDSFPLSCFYGNTTACGQENCKPYVRLEYE